MKGNLRVMSEMLNELSPGHTQPDDAELIQVSTGSQELFLIGPQQLPLTHSLEWFLNLLGQ